MKGSERTVRPPRPADRAPPSPPVDGVTKRVWMVLAVVALLVPPIFVSLPRGGPGQSWIFILVNAVAAGAVLLAPRLHRSPDRLPWRLIGLGLVTWVVANVVAYADRFLGEEGIGFPSPADGFYLAAPIFLAWGLAIIVRRQTRGGSGFALLDAGIMALGACLLSWTFILDPLSHAPGLPPLTRATALAYPITDLLLLAMLTRLLVTPAKQIRSYWLLVGALLIQIVTDTVYAITSNMGTFEAGGVLDLGWPLAILFMAMAAAHPSMRKLTAPEERPRSSRNRFRLLLLVGAALVSPVTIATSGLHGGRVDAIVLASGGGAMFLLMFMRMHRMLRVVEAAQSERGRILDRVLEAAEQERIRLAGEMHDGPVQRLTALSLHLELAKKRLIRGDGSAAHTDLERIQERFADEIHSLRAIMSDLRPPALDEKGLAAALGDEVERFRRDTGMRVLLEVELEHRIDVEGETVLYRAAQEALTNIAKHSRASHVWVSMWIQRANGQVCLRVQDDGVGFSPGLLRETEGKEHFGLMAMRERIRVLGGSSTVESAPGQGTTMEVRLPVSRDGSALAQAS